MNLRNETTWSKKIIFGLVLLVGIITLFFACNKVENYQKDLILLVPGRLSGKN